MGIDTAKVPVLLFTDNHELRSFTVQGQLVSLTGYAHERQLCTLLVERSIAAPTLKLLCLIPSLQPRAAPTALCKSFASSYQRLSTWRPAMYTLSACEPPPCCWPSCALLQAHAVTPDITPTHLARMTETEASASDAAMSSYVDVALLARARCLIAGESGFSKIAWMLGGGHACYDYLGQGPERCSELAAT